MTGDLDGPCEGSCPWAKVLLAAKHLCPPQMLTIPLTIHQQVWQRGSKKAGKRRESGREEGGEHINHFYFLL